MLRRLAKLEPRHSRVSMEDGASDAGQAGSVRSATIRLPEDYNRRRRSSASTRRGSASSVTFSPRGGEGEGERRAPRRRLVRRIGAGHGRPIKLHIYRLTNVVLDAALYALLGGGIYHTGVEVDGVEYAFGSHAESTTGVWMQEPQKLPDGFANNQAVLIRTLEVAKTHVPPRSLRRLIVELMQAWPGSSYDVLRRNCNHFSAAMIATVLEVEDGMHFIPSWVNRAATESGDIMRLFGAARSTLNTAFAHPGQGGLNFFRTVEGDAVRTPPSTPRLEPSAPRWRFWRRRKQSAEEAQEVARAPELWARRIAADYTRISTSIAATAGGAISPDLGKQRRRPIISGKSAGALPAGGRPRKPAQPRRKHWLGPGAVLRYLLGTRSEPVQNTPASAAAEPSVGGNTLGARVIFDGPPACAAEPVGTAGRGA